MKEKKTKDDLEHDVHKAHMAGAIDGFEISKLSVYISFKNTITLQKICEIIQHIQKTYDVFAVEVIADRTIRVSFLQSHVMPTHSYYITIAPNGCLSHTKKDCLKIDDSDTLNVGTQTTDMKLDIKAKMS